MRTHRGINFSSVAQEGLGGLPGVLIAVFFGFSGVLFVVGFLYPAVLYDAGGWVIPVFLLTSFAACLAYVLGQRRDNQLTAQLEQEFHRLRGEQGGALQMDGPGRNEETFGARSDEAILADLKVAETRSALDAESLSPEGMLVAAVSLFFVLAMIGVLVPMEYEGLVMGGLIAILGGVAVGLIIQRVRRHQRARLMAWDRKVKNGRD